MSTAAREHFARLALALAGACGLLACGADPMPPGARSGPPNILLILSDDHGFGDYGFMGSRVARTPHIDALAEGGSVFPLAYNTASICRPSQLSLLTGLEPLQWERTLDSLRASGPEFRGLDRIRRFATLPRALGQVGYRSVQAGKLWEGSFEHAGFSAGLKQHYVSGPRHLRAWSGGHASHAVGRRTMAPITDFIDANVERRFFVWFAPMLPHTPFDAPESLRRRYAALGLPDDAAGYYANVERLDDAVGELVAHLEKRGIRQDTLIVYLADNGYEPELEEPNGPRPGLWKGGLRGKASMYELGWRTPLVFNWPGRVPGGTSHPALVSTPDVFQTLLDYAGLLPLADRPGRSLRPILEGDAASVRDAIVGTDLGIRPREPREEADATGSLPPAYFVRDAEWHYIWHTDTGDEELYAPGPDPEERDDRSAEHPERIRAYRERIHTWIERMSEPVSPIPPMPARPRSARVPADSNDRQAAPAA